MKKHKEKIDAACRLGLDEQMVSSDLDDVSRSRRRLLGIAFAIAVAVLLVSILIALAGMEKSMQAFVTSHTFNVIAVIVGVAYLIFLILGSIKYSYRS